ncbi:hypothetical protein V5P93_000333 [Actinokineospora auranticolor]|uniref:Small secreted protein n=1 Tax=Actinokineospora auranticolor TaxID=155976 RepID=A0A2S6GKN9_9PSEU|nr:hypothetical protein [Actinokineospora auranticolor]PPK65779.1 hypothetical protein CLV40_11239 [Actinokineospora auranticolor]
MARRLVAVSVTAVALTAALAGCGGTNDAGGGTPTSAPGTTTSQAGSASASAGEVPSTTAAGTAPAGDKVVAWAEKVCGTLTPEIATLNSEPSIDPAGDSAKARDGLVKFLGVLVGALDRSAQGVQAAGAPPVADGEKLLAAQVTALSTAKTATEKAQTMMRNVSATNPAEFQAGFVQVAEELQKLDELADPIKALRANPELASAFKQGPNCKKFEQTFTGSAGSTPTS